MNENKQSLKCVVYSKNADDQKHNIHLIALSEFIGETTELRSETLSDFKIKHHYIWVKNIQRLLYGDTAHKEKKHFCNKCTQTFLSKERLGTHQNWCYGMENTPQKVTLPKANGIENFESFKHHERMMYVPCVIKVDFESKHKKTDEKYGGSMRKIAEQKAMSFSLLFQ